MFKKILLIGLDDFQIGKNCREQISKKSSKVISLSLNDSNINHELIDSDCILINTTASIDAGMLRAASALRYIGVFATGFGHVDVNTASEMGITVTNIPGPITESVAEFIFGALLEHIRDLERAKRQAREKNYSEVGFEAIEIKGKTLGVIGLGRIGKRVAELAQGFGAHVLYWSKTPKKQEDTSGMTFKEIQVLLQECDFVSINMALNPETINFFTKENIALIKKGAIVINTSPMELIDIDVLASRLSKNDLTFILDHSDELAPEDLALLSKHDNCIIYPPIAYISEEAKLLKQNMLLANMDAFIEGRKENVVSE